jgi:hypothetical protein
MDELIKMNLKDPECEYIVWIHLAQNRDKWRSVVNMVMDIQVS